MAFSATSLPLQGDFDTPFGSLVNDAAAADGGGGPDALPTGLARVPLHDARLLPETVDGTPLFPESISVRGDSPPSATLDKDRIEKLWRMVHDLKEMDSAWHEDLTISPNINEQRLYGLIMGHVSSDIFLFHRERNSSMLDQPEDDVEFTVKELKDRGSAFGVNLNTSDEEEDETDPIYTWETNDKLSDSWEQMQLLIEFLGDSRDFICGLPQGPIPANLEVIRSTEKEKNDSDADVKKIEELKGLLDPKDGVNNREQILVDILCRLGERRRERNYAPPVDEELKCYREIRKWIISASYFSYAKSDWLLCWETRRTDYLRKLGEAECANYFAMEKLHIRSGDWEYLGFDISALFHAPPGHRIAVVFDELPESRSLLSRWRKRFSDMTTRFFEKKGELMNDVNVTDVLEPLNIEVEGRKRARVGKELEVNKSEERLYSFDATEMAAPSCKLMNCVNVTDGLEPFVIEVDGRKRARVGKGVEVKKNEERLYAFDATEMAAPSCKPAAGNDKPMSKTRIQYLVDILTTFVWIRSSCSRSWLTSKEVRLYAHILQHLKSSMWLFYDTGTPGEIQQAIERKQIYERRIGKKSHVLSQLFLPAPWRWEEKTREQCLQEIVCLVEVIGSPSLSPTLTTEVIKTREQYLQEIVGLVEVIDSLFLCSVPTVEEMLVYEEIFWWYTDLDLLQSRCYLKKDIEGNTCRGALGEEVVALGKRVLKGTCAREVELAAELEKEFGDTLRMIFTNVPEETNVIEWLNENKEAAVTDLKDLAMKSSQTFEFLDHVLLSLQEANALIGRILSEFMRANSVPEQAVNMGKQYQIPLKEGWAVLRVVEASSRFI